MVVFSYHSEGSATKMTEGGAHHCLPQFVDALMEVGEGEPDGGLRLAPLPGLHRLVGFPNRSLRPGPAPRSRLSLRGRNRLEAPPHESASPGPPSPPGPVGGRGAASTG